MVDSHPKFGYSRGPEILQNVAAMREKEAAAKARKANVGIDK
jgi:hypothetical protein